MTIALDVGGTSIKSGVVTPDGSVGQVTTTVVDAGADAESIVASLASVIDRHLAALTAGVVPDLAIAFPGPFDYETGTPWLDHKFAAINGLPLAERIRPRLRRPVGGIGFANDAAAAGAGVVHRLGPDHPDTVLVVTLGTGLGSSLFEQGHLIEKRAGLDTSELWALDHGGAPADEQFSATGLARALGVTPSRLAATVDRAGDDPAVAGKLNDWGRAFGMFLAPLVEAFGARLVLVGGGASAAFAWFGPALDEALPVPVRPADHSRSAPLLGAAVLVSRSGSP